MQDGSRALMVVSADLPEGPKISPRGPRKDYVALAQALDATVLDYSQVECSVLARLIKQTFGVGAAQAWLAFQRRHGYDVILTDGEHIGIPLAVMLKLAGTTMPHVTIGHRISASKKRLMFRWLKAHTHISKIALHAKRQHEIGEKEIGIPAEQLALVPWQVDPDFWRPRPVPEERLICSAGLECRDYPVLMRAVDGMDVRVVIGASSHWSKRHNSAEDADMPENVEVSAFDFVTLRDLYARSMMVVVPLENVDFQAGITTILEAMAMGKPVIVTATRGQTDVVEDRRGSGRWGRPRPVSMLREIAERHGIHLEPNGLYVPPGDPDALRRAILHLLDNPEERTRLGQAGRRAVEALLTVDHFAERMSDLVNQALADRPRAWPDRAAASAAS